MGERHCFEPTIRATYSTRCRPSGELSSAALTSPPLYPGVDESYAREPTEMNRLSRHHLLGAFSLAAMGKGAFYRSGTVKGRQYFEDRAGRPFFLIGMNHFDSAPLAPERYLAPQVRRRCPALVEGRARRFTGLGL